MKLKKNLIWILIIGLIFLPEISAQGQNSKAPLVSIDLEKMVNNIQEVPLSMVLEKIEYIPLKVSQESYLGSRLEICLTKDLIIIYDSYPEEGRKISVFDRKTGAFLLNIGRPGKGPEEYRDALLTFYNKFNNRIYARGYSSIQVYGLDGKFIESIKQPVTEASGGKLVIDAFLNADTYVDYIWNQSDVMKDLIAIFNKEGKLLYLPKPKSWPAKFLTDEYGSSAKLPVFYTWDNKLYVKGQGNDTVFQVTADRLYPRIFLNSGTHKWEVISTRGSSKRPYMFYVYNLYESKTHFFFEYRFQYDKSLNLPYMHLGIYDKKTKKVFYCKSNTSLPILFDDITGFIPVTPVTVNENNEMIAVLQALEIVKWKNQNPSKAAALQTKLPWLKDITEYDNPVVVIGKCKE